MKIMSIKKWTLLCVFSFLMTFTYGQEKKKKEVTTVKIKTSAVCDMCKTTLEKGLVFEKGVKKSSLDVESKMLTVWYRTDKTTEHIIRKAVTNIGYDADSIPANAVAYEKLDKCCKKGYHD